MHIRKCCITLVESNFKQQHKATSEMVILFYFFEHVNNFFFLYKVTCFNETLKFVRDGI